MSNLAAGDYPGLHYITKQVIDIVNGKCHNIYYYFLHMTGPLAGVLVDKIGYRTISMIGCIGTGISMAITSFTTSFEVVVVTYGILMGKL